MTRLASLVMLVFAVSASAQTLPATSLLTPFTIRSSVDITNDTVLFSAGACNDLLTVQWSVSSYVGTPMGSMKLWATTAASCPPEATSSDKTFDEIPQYTWMTMKTGTFTVRYSDLPGFAGTTTTADGGTVVTTSCGDLGKRVSMLICGTYPSSMSLYTAATNTAASPLKVIYDTQPPTAPSIGSTSAFDGTARISFTADSDTSEVFAQARLVPDGGFPDGGDADLGFETRASASATATGVKLTGLVNNTTYQVRLFAKDAAGNQSPMSDPPVEVMPVRTIGFWGAYRDAGGTDQAGCTSVPAAWPVGALALSALLMRMRARRNRR